MSAVLLLQKELTRLQELPSSSQQLLMEQLSSKLHGLIANIQFFISGYDSCMKALKNEEEKQTKSLPIPPLDTARDFSSQKSSQDETIARSSKIQCQEQGEQTPHNDFSTEHDSGYVDENYTIECFTYEDGWRTVGTSQTYPGRAYNYEKFDLGRANFFHHNSYQALENLDDEFGYHDPMNLGRYIFPK